MSSLKSRLVVASAALVAIIAAALPASAAIGNAYTMHPLVSDVAGAAAQQDSNVVNAWGLVSGPQSFPTPWWIANNGADTSTVYNAAADAIPSLVVEIDSAPTGIVSTKRSATRQTSCSRRVDPRFHLRDGDRGHPLESGCRHDRAAGRRSLGVDVCKGPRHRADGERPSTLRERLPQQASRRLRRVLGPRPEFRLRRPQRPT
jgi:hypothetical protein